jgi:hypothetical protein
MSLSLLASNTIGYTKERSLDHEIPTVELVVWSTHVGGEE